MRGFCFGGGRTTILSLAPNCLVNGAPPFTRGQPPPARRRKNRAPRASGSPPPAERSAVCNKGLLLLEVLSSNCGSISRGNGWWRERKKRLAATSLSNCFNLHRPPRVNQPSGFAGNSYYTKNHTNCKIVSGRGIGAPVLVCLSLPLCTPPPPLPQTPQISINLKKFRQIQTFCCKMLILVKCKKSLCARL